MIVKVPGQSDGWQVSNYAFGLLADLIHQQPMSPELRDYLATARAMHVVDLNDLRGEDRVQLIELLRQSSRSLREVLTGQPDRDAWTVEFIDALVTLEMWMDGLQLTQP